MRVAITGRPQADNIYCQLKRDSDGAVWNVSGAAWVTRLSNTSGSYVTLAWDATDLEHAGTIDVTAAHPGPEPATYTVLMYKRLGGSPAVTTDTLVGGYAVTLQSGAEGLDLKAIGIEFSAAIDGSDIALQAWLTVDGETVDLGTVDPDAECVIVIKEQTSGTELLNETSSTITADNHFEITVVDAVDETNADKNYFATVTITADGVDYVREFPLTTAG